MVTGEGENRRNVRQRPTGPLSRHDVAEAAFDVSAALIVVLDRAGRIVRFNAACERLTGHREADVTGQLLWPLVLDEPEAAARKPCTPAWRRVPRSARTRTTG